MTPEKQFEKAFAFACNVAKCLYVKIPDAIMTKARLAHIRQTGRSDEPLKPFDGILITPNGNLCLEFKYQYGKLSPHQQDNREAINKINDSFVVVRLKVNTKGTVYFAEYPDHTNEFGKIADLVNHLKIYALLLSNGKEEK